MIRFTSVINMPETRCIFCDELADTREHIPPKQFFKGIPDKDLITVPSCKKCNQGFQSDEDFFRQFWVSILMGRAPRAKEIALNEMTRAILRRPALAWRMFSQMIPVNRYTASGLFVGQSTLYHITENDRTRINRIAEKIIRGLFFKEFDQTIPHDWIIGIHWITPEMEQKQNLLELAKTMKWNVIREDTFAYGVSSVPNTNQSVWLLDFFKTPLFYVLVLDKETASSNADRPQ